MLAANVKIRCMISNFTALFSAKTAYGFMKGFLLFTFFTAKYKHD